MNRPIRTAATVFGWYFLGLFWVALVNWKLAIALGCFTRSFLAIAGYRSPR